MHSHKKVNNLLSEVAEYVGKSDPYTLDDLERFYVLVTKGFIFIEKYKAKLYSNVLFKHCRESAWILAHIDTEGFRKIICPSLCVPCRWSDKKSKIDCILNNL
jgi:hypothetical protein